MMIFIDAHRVLSRHRIHKSSIHRKTRRVRRNSIYDYAYEIINDESILLIDDIKSSKNSISSDNSCWLSHKNAYQWFLEFFDIVNSCLLCDLLRADAVLGETPNVRLNASGSQLLRLRIITWNVNQQSPPDKLRSLLGQSTDPEWTPPDVVVLGLQEVTMSPRKALFNLIFHDEWSKQLDVVLSDNYSKVGTVTMVGIIMNAYVKNEHFRAVKQIEDSTVRTGFGGLYGNKGAVLLKFILYGKSFSMINCHLPAHDDGLKKRIEDYHTIEARRVSKCSRQEDYVFWFGDLNFRIADYNNMGGNVILYKLHTGQQQELLDNDELLQLKTREQIFRNWSEPNIYFQPTYKVYRESDGFDLRRRPAWTDRVLYKSDTGQQIDNTLYDSLGNFMGSDHKPVVATFKVWVDMDDF